MSQERRPQPPTNTTNSIYHRITHRMLQQMREGNLPWNKPWTSSPCTLQMPRNGLSGRHYTGINVLVLWSTECPDPRWYTFKQAIEAGGHVRKGEKGTEVLFFQVIKKKNKESGDEEEIPFARSFWVFNHTQITWPDDTASLPPPAEVYPDLQDVIARSGAIFIHGGDIAGYRPALDLISMPSFDAFNTPEDYMAVAAHELVHWSGASSRLHRSFGAPQSKEYAFEELVAELGAAFLCARCGIPTRDRHHAAYLQHWIEIGEQDVRAFVRAARLARQATEFLLDE